MWSKGSWERVQGGDIFRLWVGMTFFFLGMGVLTVFASSLQYRSLKEMVAGADYILIGTVTEIKSGWNSNRTQIFTITTVLPEEFLKGKPRESITVYTLGGIVGDIGMKVVGMPSFTKGEKVLLFAKQSKQENMVVIFGGVQGKFTIRDRPSGKGGATIRRDLTGVTLLGPQGETRTAPLQVDDLVLRIKKLLAE